MASSLEAVAFSTAFYVLGGLGFVAVTAFPFRAWRLLSRSRWAVRASTAHRIGYLLLVAAAVAGLVLAGASLVHAGRCLLGYHCGANAAGGWAAMAGVGFWYLAFEFFALVVSRLALRRSGSQPNNSSKPTPLRGAA